MGEARINDQGQRSGLLVVTAVPWKCCKQQESTYVTLSLFALSVGQHCEYEACLLPAAALWENCPSMDGVCEEVSSLKNHEFFRSRLMRSQDEGRCKLRRTAS